MGQLRIRKVVAGVDVPYGHVALPTTRYFLAKKRKIELSDFNLADLDLLKDCLKNKLLKTIDVEDFDCFDDILS